jgi:hypothetical protein
MPKKSKSKSKSKPRPKPKPQPTKVEAAIGVPEVRPEETIRGTLSDTVNELNKLLLLTTDPAEEKRLRELRRIYFALWEEVIKQTIDQMTTQYRDAIEALKIATAKAEEAQEDLSKVADAINKAVVAARAVDGIVKLGIDLVV